jgi:hypothetical protein
MSGSCEHSNVLSGCKNAGNFLTSRASIGFSRRASAPCTRNLKFIQWLCFVRFACLCPEGREKESNISCAGSDSHTEGPYIKIVDRLLGSYAFLTFPCKCHITFLPHRYTSHTVLLLITSVANLRAPSKSDFVILNNTPGFFYSLLSNVL